MIIRLGVYIRILFSKIIYMNIKGLLLGILSGISCSVGNVGPPKSEPAIELMPKWAGQITNPIKIHPNPAS